MGYFHNAKELARAIFCNLSLKVKQAAIPEDQILNNDQIVLQFLKLT